MTTLTTRATQLTTRATQPKASRKQLKQALEAFRASLPINLLAKAPALANALDLAKRLIETSTLALRYARNLLAKIAAYALNQLESKPEPTPPTPNLNQQVEQRAESKPEPKQVEQSKASQPSRKDGESKPESKTRQAS